MEETNLISFVLWAVISGMIIGITGFSYKAYLRRNQNEPSSS